MIGRAGAISALATRLGEALPVKTPQLRDRYEVDAETIPDFAEIHANQAGPLGIDQYPALELVDGPDRPWEDFETTPSGPSWVVPYGVTLWLWVMGYGAAHTALVRRHLTTAVHEVLAARQQITPQVRVMPRTIRTAPSDLATADSAEFLAGMRIELVLRVQESLQITYPIVDVIDLSDIGVIPPA